MGKSLYNRINLGRRVDLFNWISAGFGIALMGAVIAWMVGAFE